MASFLPDKDTALLAWSLNFQTLITASPTTYGLTSTQSTAYGVVHTAYATALAAVDPGQRSKSLVSAKNTARTNLKNLARLYANIVQGQATVTDAQKIELGLTVRSAPSPVPTPSDPPAIDIISVIGHTVKIRLHDSTDASRRGKPPFCKGANLFRFVGPTPPETNVGWHFEGNVTRTIVDIVFPDDVEPGTLVWITAQWYNEKGSTGPATPPVSTNIQFGMTMSG